ncbi:MAG: IPT/TIG domain-containing protein [Acidobacteriota bacterium]
MKGAFAQALTQTPALTIGPYYPDKLPLDLDNDLLVINDAINPGVGELMWVNGRVLDSGGNPVRGAVVEIWQADNNGAYIHSASPIANRDSTFQGYGKFETASDGRYVFRTVKPGIYPGRTRHIHYQIQTAGRGNLITQLHFEGEALNANDGVLNGVTNAAQKASIIKPITALATSTIGEKAVNFDIVMGFTPESTPSGTIPVISTRSGVTHAGSYQTGASPGAWISIYGFRLAGGTRIWTAADIVNGKLPTSLDGVSVSINGKDAYVYFISPTQINVQAPADSLSGTVQVVVRNSFGASAATTVQLQAVLPGFFRLAEEFVSATNPDGSYVGPVGLLNGVNTTPARVGSTITLWGSGFGPTNPSIEPGVAVNGASPLANAARIRIGNTDATIAFQGITAAGVAQFNIVVPDLATGDYPVVAQVVGVRTASIARLRVQR